MSSTCEYSKWSPRPIPRTLIEELDRLESLVPSNNAMDTRNRERRARTKANKLGLRLLKSRARNENSPNYQGYQLIRHTDQMLILGFDGWGHTRATLEDIETYLKETH